MFFRIKVDFIFNFVCPADKFFGVIDASAEALEVQVTSASQWLLQEVANASVNCYICAMTSCQLLQRYSVKSNNAVSLMLFDLRGRLVIETIANEFDL